MLLTVKNKIRMAGLKCRNVLANKSGDQMTGWLIVVLIVVVLEQHCHQDYQPFELKRNCF